MAGTSHRQVSDELKALGFLAVGASLLALNLTVTNPMLSVIGWADTNGWLFFRAGVEWAGWLLLAAAAASTANVLAGWSWPDRGAVLTLKAALAFAALGALATAALGWISFVHVDDVARWVLDLFTAQDGVTAASLGGVSVAGLIGWRRTRDAPMDHRGRATAWRMVAVGAAMLAAGNTSFVVIDVFYPSAPNGLAVAVLASEVVGWLILARSLVAFRNAAGNVGSLVPFTAGACGMTLFAVGSALLLVRTASVVPFASADSLYRWYLVPELLGWVCVCGAGAITLVRRARTHLRLAAPTA